MKKFGFRLFVLLAAVAVFAFAAFALVACNETPAGEDEYGAPDSADISAVLTDEELRAYFSFAANKCYLDPEDEGYVYTSLYYAYYDKSCLTRVKSDAPAEGRKMLEDLLNLSPQLRLFTFHTDDDGVSAVCIFNSEQAASSVMNDEELLAFVMSGFARMIVTQQGNKIILESRKNLYRDKVLNAQNNYECSDELFAFLMEALSDRSVFGAFGFLPEAICAETLDGVNVFWGLMKEDSYKESGLNVDNYEEGSYVKQCGENMYIMKFIGFEQGLDSDMFY